jgi:hypothetical protein
MSGKTLKNKNDGDKLLEEFKKLDTAGFPDFYEFEKPLEQGLWILWVAKDKLGVKGLTAEQIALMIRDSKEISVEAKAIINSFNRAGNRIHIHRVNGESLYEIMKPGKEHLTSQAKDGSVKVLYFEPEKRFSSKSLLSKNMLENLRDELRIVDPYCGERTLDVLCQLNNRKVMFLTRLDNLKGIQRQSFLRNLKDFKSENTNMEFRDYPSVDIHDRYIISSNLLVILGHSIKDLGSKESFAVILDSKTSENIFEALLENFNRRWKSSNVI